MAWRSMPLQIASRSLSSATMDPGAPLKVKWYQVGAGARRITMPGVRWAVTISSSVPTPAASIALFCSAGMTAEVSSTRKVMESSRGFVPHQRGLRVSTMRCAPRSIVDTMNGPADGPGASSWPLLKTSGFAVMLRGCIPPANIPRHSAYGSAKVTTAWRSSTPLVTDFTRSNPALLAIKNLLSRPLHASTSALRSSQVIGVPSFQVAFGLMV